MSTPYTYYLYHKPTGKKYYGVKFGKNADPAMFWTLGGYYSSSVYVHALIEQYGADSFDAQVRRTFKTRQMAQDWEDKFLKKVNAVLSPDWLNKSRAGKKFCNVGPMSMQARQNMKKGRVGFKPSPESNAKRSATMKGKSKPDITKHRMSLAQQNRPLEQEQARRNKIREKAMGRSHSEETAHKLSDIVSNTVHVTDGVSSKKVNKEELDQFLLENSGWRTGRPPPQRVTCPHCGLTGAKHNVVRRHFDKCDLNPAK